MPQTAAEFCRTNGIISTAVRTTHNPHIGGAGMSHWSVTLERFAVHESGLVHPRLAHMTTVFSQGAAFKGKAPTVAAVVGCLVMDAMPFNDGLVTFEDWADEYGYDTDSRKAEAIYNACRQSAVELRAFLGRALFAQVLQEGLDE